MKNIQQLGISPAPWRVNDNEYGDPNEVLCDYICDEFQKGQKRTRVIAETNHHFAESENDARLIAAAPELYEALAGLVDFIDRECVPCGENACELMTIAHAALAAASGESEKGEAK